MLAFTIVQNIVMASICLVLTIVIVGQILVNGKADLDGFLMKEYVQYCHDGEWHWLCAGSGTWSKVEANVVCRQLGLGGHGAKKGSGAAPTVADQLPLAHFMFGDTSCAGGEYNIGECKGISYPSTCGTDNDGWVDCQPANCNNGDIRLVGGTTIREGRVDFCTQGQWASVCYNEDLELVGTICKMLGFPMQGAMAKSTTSSIDPKVNCTVTDDGTTLNCGDTIQPHICDMASLVIKCQTFNYDVHTLAINGTCTSPPDNTLDCPSPPNNTLDCPSPPNNTLDCPSPPNNTLDCNCNPAIPSSSTPSTTTPACSDSNPLGAVIGLLVLLEVGTVIAWVACTVTRKRDSSPTKQRALLQVNESYTDTNIEPSYSSLGPNYNTVTTSDEGIDDYDVIDHNKQKPKPSNPPPVTAEASKSEDEFFNAEEHMYAAVNKEKKKHATKVGGE